MSAVTVRGVSKSFGVQPVLDGIDLEVPTGSITAVLGTSGCGKSTLLRVVAGFLRADAGTVTVGGREVSAPGRHVRPQARGVAYVPQEGALFPHLDVRRNVLFGLPRGARTSSRLHELLELAELPAELATRFPHELSGGQQQRVALARALAPEPEVILLDEPFSSLDSSLRASAGRTVARVLRHAGTTALLVTHDQGEALSLSDQVALMRAGRFVQVASPADVYDDPADAEVASFVGGGSLLAARVVDGLATCALGVVPLARSVPDGAVRLVLRPEQVEILDGAAPGGPSHAGVAGTVIEVDYFGAQVVVLLELAGGERLSARGPASRPPGAGDAVCVRFVGLAHAYPGTGS